MCTIDTFGSFVGLVGLMRGGVGCGETFKFYEIL